MSDLQLDIDFRLNTPEAQAEAQRIRESVAGIGDSAEQANNRVTQSINNINNRTRGSFNGLQNSINQISRELPAFTYSAQTGFMAISNNIPMLIDQIGSLRRQNAELVASGQSATPVWRQLVSGLFSWGTAMSVGITLLTVYGKEIGNFIAALFKGAEAIDVAKERIKSLNAALESTDYKKAITNVNELTINIDLAKKGLLSKEQVLKQYNETIGKTTGRVDSLKQAEKELGENADAYVKMTLYKAAAQLALEEAAKKSLEAEQQRLKKADEFRTGFDKFTDATMAVGAGPGARVDLVKERQNAAKRNEDRKKVAIEETEKLAKVQEDIAKTFQEKAAKIAADPKNKFNFFGDNKADKTQDDSKDILNSRKNILDKLAALDAEYTRKGFSKDEEELQALRDKFKAFHKVIEEENQKIAEYNKKHKNKIGLIDVGSVAPIEDRAISDLKYRQQTEHLKTSIAEQKRLYDEFETYKATFGEAKAKERFGKQIDTEKTYLQQLQAGYAITMAQGFVGGFTPIVQERLAAQGKAIKQEQSAEQKALDDAYKAVQTQAEKVLLIRQRYVNMASKLGANITEAQRADLVRQMDNEIKAANQTAFEKTAIYRKMNEQTITYTKEALKAEIRAAENILKSSNLDDGLRSQIEGNLTKLKGFLAQGVGKTNKAELERQKKLLETAIVDPLISGTEKAEEYRRKLIEIQRQIDTTSDGGAFSKMFEGNASQVAANVSGGLGELSGAFGELSASLEGTNDELAYTLGSIGQLVKVGSDAAGAFSSFASGDIIGGISKTVSAVAGLFSMGKKVREMNEKARAEQKKYYDEAVKGERDYQALLRKREQDDVKRGKNSYRTIVDQLDLLKKQSPEIKKAYDAIFNSLQGQQFVDGVGYKHGTWLRKAKTWDIMASLAGSDYDQLEKLYTQGKLKDQAKADFEALKALKEELKEAGVNVQELQTQLNELLTGTNVSGLADGLMALFENGKMAAEDFGQSFEEIMRKALNNSFKEKYLKDALQPLYDEFAALFVNGTPTEDELAALKAKYQSIGADFANRYKELEKVTGVNLTGGDTTSNPNTIRGNVENITAKQADVLSGNIAGMRLTQIEGNGIVKAGFDQFNLTATEQLAAIKAQNVTQAEISANTLRTANNTERLQAIEKALVSMDNKMSNNSNSIRAAGG